MSVFFSRNVKRLITLALLLSCDLAFGYPYNGNFHLYQEDDASQRQMYVLSLSKEDFVSNFVGGLALGHLTGPTQRYAAAQAIHEAMEWRRNNLNDKTSFGKIAQRLINEWFNRSTMFHREQIENLIYFLGRSPSKESYSFLTDIELKAKVRIEAIRKDWGKSAAHYDPELSSILRKEPAELYEIIGMAQQTKDSIEDSVSPTYKKISSIVNQLNYCTELMLLHGLSVVE